MQVVTEVFILNIVLAILAALSILLQSPYVQLMALALGSGCVTLVLSRFSRKREPLR